MNAVYIASGKSNTEVPFFGEGFPEGDADTLLEFDGAGETYPHTAQGAWAAWCKTRDAKDAAGFATFIGETCPVVASTAKAKGMKFSQVANEEDWARIIDALTAACADQVAADDPSDLPF